MCDFCIEGIPYNTNYGAIWVDKTDKLGDLKWTSKQCPPKTSCDECSCKDINIINTIKINFCPMCGRNLATDNEVEDGK